jgi:Tfp pilus assembly protein PilN
VAYPLDADQKKEGNTMNHMILQDVRAAFFLMMGLLMLAMICAVAALGTVMRPVRWADRRSAQF